MKKTIAIIGCGWFGKPLALELIESGYKVIGSSTSSEKINPLRSDGINAHLISVNDSGVQGDFRPFLEAEVLVINIPPRRKSNDVSKYKNRIEHLIKLTPVSTRIIFVSSTSVYQNTNGIVDESTQCKPTTESGKALLDTENLLKVRAAIILRFAGLIGPNRPAGRFLSGKKDINNGKAPVNLVHLDDCIAITQKIIEDDITSEVFNVCSSDHPEKQEYYVQAALKDGFDPPEFIDELVDYKIVDNKKASEILQHSFRSIY